MLACDAGHEGGGDGLFAPDEQEWRVKIVRALLEAGAKLGSKDDDGNTAMDYATSKKMDLVVDVLIEAGAKPSKGRLRKPIEEMEDDLFDEIEAGDLSEVKYLIKAGVGIEERNVHGLTPLMAAATFIDDESEDGRAKIARFLLGKGADANAVSEPLYTEEHQPETALQIAMRTGASKVVDVLVRAGVSPDTGKK